MYYNRKKYIIKNIIFIIFILLIAIFATNYIYYKFKNDRNVDYSSKSLDIVLTDIEGDKINIEKPTPVTDAVGLSSKAYTLTIKNNLTEKVSYEVKLLDNIAQIKQDNCQDKLIPKEILKVSIKKDKDKNKVLTLTDLENNTLDSNTIKALEEVTYTIRVWVSNTSDMFTNKDSHYHGILKVVEQENK